MGEMFLKTVLILFCLSLYTASALSIERLVIPGTGDSQKLLRDAVRLFERDHPDVVIDIPESVGSAGGIKRVINGHAPIARIARQLNDSELESGLQSLVFAYTPIVFVANLPEQCIDDLSTSDIIDVYSGKITSWQQLGNCPDHKIYVANREEGDSSRLLIEENLSGFKDIQNFAGEIIYSTPEALHVIEDHPYTIGYLPLAMLDNSPLSRFSINGLHPTVENLVAKNYSLAVPLGFTWKVQPTGTYRQFVDFLFSAQGQEVIRSLDAVPVPKPSGY